MGRKTQLSYGTGQDVLSAAASLICIGFYDWFYVGVNVMVYARVYVRMGRIMLLSF
jgi:hypothetical protein